MICYADLNDSILGIHPLENDRHMSFSDVWTCRSDTELETMSLCSIIVLLAAFIGKNDSYDITCITKNLHQQSINNLQWPNLGI
jgi:hypothetical protein